MNERILLGFLLTLLAGLSTGIGSAMALLAHKTSRSFLSFSLGLSAGVMIYVSFVDLLFISRETLEQSFGPGRGAAYSTLAFFGGILLIALIDRLVPSIENPHEARSVEEMSLDAPRLMRMGLLTAVAIAIHNFPEGLATLTATLSSPTVGVSVAVAIAIHNIPEGIAVSVPVFYATGSRKKAFWLSFLSGVSEPVGAIVGYLLLRSYFSQGLMGIIFAAIAGIMVFVSLDELFPAAREYGRPHLAIYGLVGGMAIMAVSLLMLG